MSIVKRSCPEDLGITSSVGPAKSFEAREYVARLRRFSRKLEAMGLDGAIVTSRISRLYLTGFDSSDGVLIVQPDKGAVFITDFRYIIMAKKAMPFVKCLLQRSGAKSELALHSRRFRRCGYESGDSAQFEKQAAQAQQVAQWRKIDEMLADLRAVKSAAECALLRRAVAANDALYAWALPQIEPGMTEWDIRLLFRYGADRLGQGEAFPTIVCVGANGAECHHSPNTTDLRPRQSLLLDFGLSLDSYASDMTRCRYFGKPTPLYEKIYMTALEANRAVVENMKPGMTGAEVDAIARKHIAKAGYSEAFGHALGHGLGLEVHERPSLSMRETRVLKPGMIVTVEPGIYLPGRAGVRVEDVVLVTRDGCETLSKSGRALS